MLHLVRSSRRRRRFGTGLGRFFGQVQERRLLVGYNLGRSECSQARLRPTMVKGNRETSELVNAAEALENELLKLEALSKSVRKLRLSSEKTITRAAKELSEALALRDGLAEGLQALAASMARMQARQSAALEPLAAFATE